MTLGERHPPGGLPDAPRPRADGDAPPDARPGLRELRGAALVAGLAVLASLAGRLHGLDIEDDAFVFVRYASNLLEHGSISWNPGGPPTYGTTSLLYLAVVSLVRAVLGASPARVAVVSSLACGIAFAAAAVRLARRASSPAEPRGRAVLHLFLVLPAAWAAESLTAHFATGMDTMLALLAASLAILAALAFEERASLRRGAWFAVTTGAAYFARPDLVLYTFPLLLAVGLRPAPGTSRGVALRAVAASLVLTAAGVGAAWATFGDPLPLSFFVKSAVRYGGDLEAAYAGVSGRQLALYAASYGLWAVPIAARVLRDARRRRWSFSGVETALLASTVAFVLYYRFFVLQVMPHYQRFYYPTLPALLFLAARSASVWAGDPASSIRRGLAGLGAPGRGVAVARGAACLVLLLPAALPVQRSLVRLRAQPPFYRIDVMDNHGGSGRRTWFRLDAFARLPDDLVLATTEIGLPGVVFQEKKIVDLSGLNDPRFARHGFDAEAFFGTDRPDLVYMPHPDYRLLTKHFLEDPAFYADYDYYPGSLLHTTLGIALRKTSVHYRAMREILYAGSARAR